MEMDISRHLAHLLMWNESLPLPGMGVLILKKEPAYLAPSGEAVQPPERKPVFRESPSTNVTELVQVVQQRFNLPTEVAQRIVHQFLERCRQSLETTGAIDLPGIGRLYQGKRQKLHLLRNSGNLAKESFGLPVLRLQPLRTEPAIIEEAKAELPISATAASDSKDSPRSGFSDWFQQNLAWISAAGVILLGIGLFLVFYYRNSDRFATSSGTLSIPSERLNVPPTTGEADAEPFNPATDEPDTEGITPLPDQQYVMIGIGLFREDANVQKLLQDIAEAGFEPYTEPINGLTRVGVQMTYRKEEEVRKALREIREQFASDAVVVQRGKRQSSSE